MDESLSISLPAMYFTIYRLRAPFSKEMTRALKLFARLAPVKVCKMVHDMIDRDYDNKMEEIDAHYDMKQDLKKNWSKATPFYSS